VRVNREHKACTQATVAQPNCIKCYKYREEPQIAKNLSKKEFKFTNNNQKKAT
jgi:hypothetical protein